MSFKSMAGIPAVKALLLQVLAGGITFLSLVLYVTTVHATPGWTAAALIQGSIAALLSIFFRQARWWVAIQLLFPVALVLALRLQLPPSLFLIAFLLLLLVYWSTFRTQVPFYPSGSAVQTAIADLLPAERAIRFIDIGSGLGDLILNLAEHFPAHRFVGIEIAPLPWLISWLRARFAGGDARFLYGDYERLHFSGYDMIFAYLSPAAMPALWHKAQTEMREKSLLLSYEFPIPSVVPTFVITIPSSEIKLYGFRI